MTLHGLFQIQFSRGEQYAQQVSALFCETSALDATNVEELFIQISKFKRSIIDWLEASSSGWIPDSKQAPLD